MSYSKFSLGQRKNLQLPKMHNDNIAGISLGQNGKFIVRVKTKEKGNGNYLKTISQHTNKEEAELAYNNFYNNK